VASIAASRIHRLAAAATKPKTLLPTKRREAHPDLRSAASPGICLGDRHMISASFRSRAGRTKREAQLAARPHLVE
jgi:hypothetical protein